MCERKESCWGWRGESHWWGVRGDRESLVAAAGVSKGLGLILIRKDYERNFEVAEGSKNFL